MSWVALLWRCLNCRCRFATGLRPRRRREVRCPNCLSTELETEGRDGA